MYIEKQLQNAVVYKFGKDKRNSPVVKVDYNGCTIAMLAVPPYETDVEACQRHIYGVVRSYIKMMEVSRK